MTFPQSCDSDSTERMSGRSLAYDHSSMIYGVNPAIPACSIRQGFGKESVPCYTNINAKAVLQSSHSEGTGAYTLMDQVHLTEQSIPYKVPVQFPCRTNGLPLATIAESDSHSTVQPQTFHSVTPGESDAQILHKSCSDTRGPPLPSTGGDDTGVNNHGRHGNGQIVHHTGPNAGSRTQCSEYMPISTKPRCGEPAESSKPSGVGNDTEGKGLKGLIRSIMHNVRSVSRDSGSCSSLATSQMPEILSKGRSPLPNRSQDGFNLFPEDVSEVRADFQRKFSDRELHTRRHAPTERGARRANSAVRHEKAVQEATEPFMRVSHRIPLPFAGRYGSWSYVGSVGRRGGADPSVESTFDTPTLDESYSERVRDVSSSGTASTRYSGTVLGIDLDLQSDPNAKRRSPSPVLFGTPMSKCSEEELEWANPTLDTALPRSIISCTLPVLLPLAAAMGIVQLNTTTPHVSFYSPSGNVIHVQEGPELSCRGARYDQTRFTASETCARLGAVHAARPPHSSISLPTGFKKTQSSNHHQDHSSVVSQTVHTSSGMRWNGVNYMNNLAPKSGAMSFRGLCGQPRHQHTHARPKLDLIRNMGAVASCTPLSKGRPHKRKAKDESEAATYWSGKNGTGSTSNHTIRSNGSGEHRRKTPTFLSGCFKRSIDGLGYLAGRTFTVRLCQIHDVPPMHPQLPPAAGPLHVAGNYRYCAGEPCHDHAPISRCCGACAYKDCRPKVVGVALDEGS